MIQGTIQADGLTWPAQTYVDALRFCEVDLFDPPCLDERVRLVTIDRDLRVNAPAFAGEIDWLRTLAYRPLEYTNAAAPCRICNEQSLNIEDDICAACEGDPLALWAGY